MRFYAHALTSLMLLSTLATASAEPLTERMVALLNDVCISPATPEEMMSAGEKAAAASGWNLLRSGPAPVPMLHNENGPKLARISGWTADLPGAPGSHVFVSILGPELPDSKWNGCIIQPSVDFKREDVVSAVELHLGSFLTRLEPKRLSDDEIWMFNDELKAGRCRRKVTLSLHQTVRALMFTEFSLPDNSPAARALTSCDR